MEIISTQKQITLHKKAEIKELLKEATEHHAQCEVAYASVVRGQRLALWHAWQAGIRLNRMKALIPRGDWVDWLDLNFCGPVKVSLRTAQLYMKIDADNADLREHAKAQRVAPTESDLQLLTKLKLDTIRKYAYSFIPEKPHPSKGRDIKIPPLYSFLNIINEYNRIRYRHVCGLHEVNFEDVREEAKELYQFLRWVNGDSEQNPWDSYVYPNWHKTALRRKEERVIQIAEQRFREAFPDESMDLG
jgi:hypothetical protein